AGRPRRALDVDDRAIPHELDLLRTAVHLDKGCYRGQETVARVHNLGRHAPPPGHCDRPRNASGGASTLDRSPATPCPERGGRSAMTYVIALPCVDVKDKACIDECPVDCIYEGERMLYIHPDECVDCGACEPVCPVEAIYYEDDTPEEWAEYYKANVEFFDDLGSPGGAAKLGMIAKDHPIISALPLQNADA
ncbi:hypothetical protein D8M29_12530, partial [Micrococcus sp. HSID17227]